MQTALGLAERGYILESGRLVLEGRAGELLGSDEVKQIFLGDNDSPLLEIQLSLAIV